MDPSSGSPYTVEPLPFHGMTRYPFGASGGGRAETPDERRYRETYNTRQVIRTLPPLTGDRAVQPRGPLP
jgi:hypothetical protein